MDPVTAAIVAAGLTSTTTQAVPDAYEALKAALRSRFPRVDVRTIEELPGCRAKHESD